jgi:hypothetical protein
VEPKDKYPYEFYSLIEKRKYDAIRPGAIFAHNSPIYLGEGFYVSIQASEYHYCDPTETYENLMDYTAFEVGIFRQISKSEMHGVLVINDYIHLMDYSMNDDFIFQEALEGRIVNGRFAVPEIQVITATFVPPKTVQSIVDEVRAIVRKIQSRSVIVEKFVVKPMISY